MSHDVVSRDARVSPRHTKERPMPHEGLLARSLAVAIAGASLIACVARAPEPIPPQPVAPRALTITAQRTQSQRQQDRDSTDGHALASSQATSSAAWAIFSSWMGDRGYTVQ